jgi:hypothetical protein
MSHARELGRCMVVASSGFREEPQFSVAYPHAMIEWQTLRAVTGTNFDNALHRRSCDPVIASAGSSLAVWCAPMNDVRSAQTGGIRLHRGTFF